MNDWFKNDYIEKGIPPGATEWLLCNPRPSDLLHNRAESLLLQYCQPHMHNAVESDRECHWTLGNNIYKISTHAAKMQSYRLIYENY